MQTTWDKGLDELAAAMRTAFLPRITVAACLALLASPLLPSSQVLAWLAATVAAEGVASLSSRAPALRARRGRARSAVLLAVMSATGVLWVGLGCLLWLSGSVEGAVAAGFIWVTMVFFAQLNAYQSPAVIIATSAASSGLILGVVALGPDPVGLERGPLLCLMGFALVTAGGGVKRVIEAGRRYEDSLARLHERDAQYSVLAANVTDVIALTKLDGRLTYVSPSVERLHGLTVEELMAEPARGVHPEDRPALRRRVDAMIAHGGSFAAEYRLKRADGVDIWVETNFSLAESAEPGAAPQVVSVSREVGARKALERELIEARESAEAAAAAKSDFLANMTHELRTPLNAIIGFSGLLHASPRLEPEDARHARLINEASQTLLELVNSVLDFSRLEAGAVELECTPFRASAEIESVVDMLSAQAADRGLTLALVADEKAAPLMGDAGRIRQVAINFVSNALKFTASGGVTIVVAQAPTEDGAERLRVEVTDTGVGVAADQIEQLFERFTQADVSVSRRYGGTGLGLAICKRTIELMGGRLGASSVEGRGSTFWFELVLPVAEAADLARPDVAAEVILDAPLRLLLVEDVAVNRELVQALLQPFDVELQVASNGLEALEAVRRDRFDLILMDVQMPVMDGLTAARRIRAMDDPASRAVPIVAMTANVLPEQIAKCLEAGMDDHLGKPIVPARLLEVLSRWAAGRPADEEQKGAARLG